ncbi:hypothetical protein ASE07_24160 [Noviherbaspirillum sp. Root189]|nr:hypothetical protein ASE07_24160 [Noviherbaspirillum sp. Root189]
MVSIPWEEVAGRQFEDKEVYLERFLELESVIDEKEITSHVDFFLNEALWDVLVRQATHTFDMSVLAVLAVVSFLCLFSFARFLVKRHGMVSLLFLFNPLVIDFAFSQLRLALAMAITMPLFEAKNKKWAIIPVIVACYIHTATILFAGMYLAGWFIARHMAQKRMSPAVIGGVLIGIGFTVALCIGPLRDAILSAIGDRRAEYEMRPATLLYASFWVLLMIVIPLQKLSFYDIDAHILAVAALATFAASTAFGINGVRFIAATYPFIASAIFCLNRTVRPAMIFAFIGYMAVQWYFWLQ